MYRTMQIAAVEGIKRYPEDPVYKLYYYRNGEAEEGLNEIEGFPDVALPCCILLTHIQQPNESFDNILRGKAKEYLEVAGEMASVLMGWIELLTHEGSPSKDILKYFESSDNSSPEAVFLVVLNILKDKKNYVKSPGIYESSYSSFPPSILQHLLKNENPFSSRRLGSNINCCSRALLFWMENIEALRFKLMHLLTQGAKIEEFNIWDIKLKSDQQTINAVPYI
ncbi:tetratricopeptide repeat protein 21B [Caerostris extrusa]|uniref:Tetratricopeptide repeat protein 21B n=1 Tax=Caerostris extrusa TaxID=172846 RepID=A0AAV4XMP7_CAEEX|nr:tetratricopeptide repeat protein 21B [Caerostris extrusa]